jgi:hypothetical protein
VSPAEVKSSPEFEARIEHSDELATLVKGEGRTSVAWPEAGAVSHTNDQVGAGIDEGG